MHAFNSMSPDVKIEPPSLVRRCNELKAENARLRHAARQLRTELATLRACLVAAPVELDPARELAHALLDAFEHRATFDGKVELRVGGNFHQLARKAVKS